MIATGHNRPRRRVCFRVPDSNELRRRLGPTPPAVDSSAGGTLRVARLREELEKVRCRLRALRENQLLSTTRTEDEEWTRPET
jgi:hypothetical protein